VVEPRDLKDYRKRFPDVPTLVLPKEDQGLWFVRNWIKGYSRKRNEGSHWQIDDNIRAFHIKPTETRKTISKRADDTLNRAEAIVARYSNIGAAGLKHAAFAFAAKTDISVNQQVYSCVLLRNDTEARYRKGVVDDTDYSMQILTSGFCTLLFNHLIIFKATTLTMTGGCTEIDYGGIGRKIRSEGLQRAWPGVFETTIKNGVWRVKPSRVWARFPQRPAPI
jgi:hypothetical protein